MSYPSSSVVPGSLSVAGSRNQRSADQAYRPGSTPTAGRSRLRQLRSSTPALGRRCPRPLPPTPKRVNPTGSPAWSLRNSRNSPILTVQSSSRAGASLMRFGCRSFALRWEGSPPEHLHIDFVPVADETRHVNVVPGEVGCRVEQVNEVLPADDVRRIEREKLIQLFGVVLFQVREKFGERFQPNISHGGDALVLHRVRPSSRRWPSSRPGRHVDPEHLRRVAAVLAGELSAAVAPTESLHQTRPRCQFGNERPGRGVNAGLYYLG